MILSEELLTYILDFSPHWQDSPGDFFRFVRTTFELSKIHAETAGYAGLGVTSTETAFAQLLVSVFRVNLYPYATFDELQSDFSADFDVEQALEELRQKSREADQVFNLYDELKSSGILPNQETVMEDLAEEQRVQATLNRLRPYVTFI